MKFKARYHEFMIYFMNRPSEYLFALLVGSLGKSVYVPFASTYFINDPLLAKKILNDTESFSSVHIGSVGYMTSLIMGKNSKALFNMEGPEHLTLRRQLVSIFQPEFISSMTVESLKPEFDRILEESRKGKPIDMAQVSARSASRITCHMLGIIDDSVEFEALLQKVIEMSNEITKILSFKKLIPTADEVAAGRKVYKQFCLLIKKYYFSSTIHKNSIIYKLKEAGMDFDSAKSLLVVLIMAGTETISSAMPRILAMLIDDNQWSLIKTTDDLLKIVDEGLRLTAPAPAIAHSVLKVNTIDKKKYLADKRVMIMLMNMLRNEKYYLESNSIDINRKTNPAYQNFWFGSGAHYCIGAQLARQEVKYILERVSTIFPSPKIIKRSYKNDTSFPGYENLVLTNLNT